MSKTMHDRKGREIKVGSVLFYSERPHSKEADSLVHIYDDAGVEKVEALVINWGDAYQTHARDEQNDLPLKNYSWDYHHKPTGKCRGLLLLGEVTCESATVEYANKRFPLES